MILHFLVTSVIIQYYISISTPSTVQENLQYAKLAVDTFSIFEVIVFVVMIIVYPPYPAPYSAEKYFMERGYEAAVSEFNFVTRILYVAVPLLIFFTIITFLQPFLENFFPAKEFLLPVTGQYCFLLCKRLSISSCSRWHLENCICTCSKEVQIVLCERMSNVNQKKQRRSRKNGLPDNGTKLLQFLPS